jgi:hypothetical protein
VAAASSNDRDVDGAPKVIMIDDRLARRFLGQPESDRRPSHVQAGDNADLTANTAKTEFFTVVGVVAEMKQRSLTDGDQAVGAYFFRWPRTRRAV